MADTGILATTASVQYKAGANCSSTSNTETYINNFVAQAEGFVNVATRKNWCDAYSTLNSDVKQILQDAVSCLAAIYVINYDMSSANCSRIEFEDRINILYKRVMDCIEVLKASKFITGA
jgi:hypothetical protein